MIAVGPLASLSLAQTCDVTWASTSTSGNWSTASNWSSASVPTSSQNVCLPAGAYTVTVTGAQTAGSVSVGAGVTLAITISGGNGAALTLSQNGTSANSGTISLTDTDASGTGSPVATLQLDTGATLTNDGTIISDAGAAGLGTRQIVAQATSSTLNNASDGTITVNQDLLMDSAGSGTFTTSGAVTIASGKKLLVGSAGGGTLNIAGGTITDNGTFEQAISETAPAGNGTLNVTGGTITGAGLLAALPSAVSFNGSGTGTYTFEGVSGATCGGPCTIAGTIGSGQTVVLRASTATGPVHLTAASNVTNDGTIKLTDPDTTGASQEADLGIASGSTLTNDGTIISDPGGAGLGNNQIGGIGTTGTLDNAAGGTITVNQDLQIDSQQSGLFETSGNIAIASGEKLLADPAGAGLGGSPPKESAEMDINGGTITNNGAFEQGFTEAGSIGGSAALKVSGGTITGAGLKVVSGATSDLAGSGEGATFTGSGTGTYTFVGSLSANTTTLGGTIGANQTVVLSASTADGAVPLQLNSNVSNDGTIELTDSDTSGTNQNAAVIQIDTGDTLTNNGTISSLPGPIGAGTRVINGQSATGVLDNAAGGTINAQQDLQIDNQAGTFTSTGTITVPAAGTLQMDPNGSGGGATTVNLNGGTVTNNGTAEIGINTSGNAAAGATFDVNGGAVSGNPIISANATTNFSGSGSGPFMIEGATSIFGGGTISGTIGANDNVTMNATAGASGSAAVATSGAVVNNGTFTMTDPDSSPSTSVFDELNIGSGSSFTNNGTMVIAAGPAGSGYRSIDGTLDNAGTLDVNMLLQLGLHATSTLDNSGSVDIGAGQGLMDEAGAGSYVQSSGTTHLGGGGAALTTASMLVGGGAITGAGTICGLGGTQANPCGSGSGATSLVNGGTIAPGPTPSTLTVQGDYSQSTGGTLAVGVNAGGNDQLSVTGSGDTASLDGALQVSTASGFTPTTGTAYDIVNAPGGVSGTFAGTSGTGPYTLAYNAGNVTLTAATAAPAVSFSSPSLTFGSASDTIAVGTTSSQALTLTNTGHASLVLGALSLTGADATDFSLSSDQCSGQTIQAGASCTVSVSYRPTAAGTDSAQLNVPDNATGSPQQVSLTGHAGAAGPRAALSVTTVDFGPVGIGVPSNGNLSVKNTGTAPLDVSTAAIGGPAASDFKLDSDGCSGQAIAVGSTCSLSLTLTASATGTRSATLSLSDNAPGSPQTVALTGAATSSGTLTGAVLTGVAGNTLPIPGATVDLCSYGAGNDFGCRSTSTSGSGVYTFTGLTPGAYRMEAQPPQGSLQPGSAVAQVVAGPNTEDFTLTAPQPIPAGLSINGRTGGTASSFWTSPDVIQAPLDAPSKGSPGLYGVTVMNFSAAPAGGAGTAQPEARGELQVEYRFDSSGVPRLVAIDSTVGNRATSLGSWSTSLASAPAAGTDVRGMLVQGAFTPSQLALPGELVTVSAGGGKSTLSTAPVHGEFDYTIGHWSEFGSLASVAARAARRPMARGAQAGTDASAGLLGALAGASSDPSTQPCPSYPTYSNPAGGQPTWTLPNGDQWTAVTTTIHTTSTVGDPVVDTLNGVEWQLTTPGGVAVDVRAPIQAQSANTIGIASPETISVTADVNGTPQDWQVWSGGPQSHPDSALPSQYWPDADGFILGVNIYVNPDGSYIADMMNAYNAQGNFDPRYAFYNDGTLHDLQTGAVWSANGRVITPGSFRGAPCGQAGPPQPSGPPDDPSTTPTPDDPNGDWAWIEHIFDYKDPSGTVVTTRKVPVAGAKVVLERSATKKGPFKAVPKGSIVMSPSNRRNPDHTTALGGFGWDVLNGYYRITAQHRGCRAAGGGAVASTPALAVPPPVAGLKLSLRCPHLTRKPTRTTLRARKIPIDEIALTATVRGHQPAGLVEFTRNGRRLGYVPLEPRRYRVVLTVAGKSTKGFRAEYLGDGYNSPSGGHA